MLTLFRTNATEPRAVTVILSGARPVQTVASEPSRSVAIDGRLPDLDTNPSPHLVPWVSDNWTRHFTWKGSGALPDEERQRLRQIVKRAHEQGRRIRFWAVPDLPAAWTELRQAGVDLINTDRLDGLKVFLLQVPVPHQP
jgi:hypothetical protein